MKIRLLLTSVLLAFMLPCAVLPQAGLLVRNIDVQQFPLVHADIYAFDAEGNLLKNIGPTDIRITGDSAHERTVAEISCLPHEAPARLSTAIMLDISSTVDAEMLNISKTTAAAWTHLMEADSSETAITAFNHLPYLYQDLTADKQRLLKAINSVKGSGGKDYNAAFLKTPSGAIDIVQRGAGRRVLLLITHGIFKGDESAIIDAARENNITVFVIGIKFQLDSALKNIALKTGGEWFENIGNTDEAATTARRAYALARGGKPCRVTWQSEISCFKNHTATIDIPSLAETETFEFTIPQQRNVHLSVKPAGIEFGRIAPGAFKDTVFTITAENGDIRIDEITGSNEVFIVEAGSFLLKTGESKDVTVRFQPKDSALVFGKISFKTDACTTDAGYARGGFPEKTTARLLKIVSPNGGEILPANGTSVIEWTGVLPQDTVRIEYTSDGGETWKTITENATGLRYTWQVPDTVSSSVLLRVQEKNGPANTWRPISKIIFKKEPDRIRAILSPDGNRVLTLQNETADVWDATTGMHLLSLPYPQRISAIAYSRSGKYIATTFKDTAAYAIYDAISGELYRTSGTSKSGSYFNSINIHPQDSSIILSESDGGIYVQAIFIPGAPFKIIPGIFFTPVYSVRYSGNGEFFVVTEEDSVAVYSIDNNLLNNVKLVTKIYQSHLDIYDYGAGLGFSGDRAYASVQEKATGQVNTVMWDTKSKERIRIFVTPRGYARSARLSWNDSLLAVGEAIASDTNNAYVFDVESSQVIATLSAHKRLVDDVNFSADSKRIVTASRDASVIIWEKSPLPDSSDAYFSTSGPRVFPQEVDLGRILVNVQKDTVVTKFLCNTTLSAVAIDSLKLKRNNEFSLLKTDGFLLDSNSCFSLFAGFKTGSAGIFTDTIQVFTPFGISESIIRAEVVQPAITVANIIDFGRVFKGNSKDTVVEISLKNNSPSPVTITGTKITGPDTSQFSIVSGGGAFTLAPNASRRMEFRFSPDSVGRAGTTVSFIFKNDNPSSQQWPGPAIQLFGEGFCLGSNSTAQIMFTESSISTRTGQFLKIPLKVIPPANSLQNVPRGFYTEIRFNKSVLFPVSPTPYGYVDGNDRVITLTGRRDNASDILAELTFTAALGDTGTALLKIENFRWEICGGPTETFATEIMIENICETDGAKRFFKDTDMPGMIILQNPFGETAEVQYRLIEPGQTEIFLMDITGRKVAVLINENAVPGQYIKTLDAHNLAAGVYFLVMQTPTQFITQRIEKMR